MKKSSSYQTKKRYQFESYCKSVLRNEVRDCYKEDERSLKQESLFSELDCHEKNQLYIMDEYFAQDHFFNVLGNDVVVKGDELAEAISSLPEQRRDILLLSYFLDMSDREIGEKLNLVRRTVQYQRASSLKQLKQILEGGNTKDEYK